MRQTLLGPGEQIVNPLLPHFAMFCFGVPLNLIKKYIGSKDCFLRFILFIHNNRSVVKYMWATLMRHICTHAKKCVYISFLFSMFFFRWDFFLFELLSSEFLWQNKVFQTLFKVFYLKIIASAAKNIFFCAKKRKKWKCNMLEKYRDVVKNNELFYGDFWLFFSTFVRIMEQSTLYWLT